MKMSGNSNGTSLLAVVTIFAVLVVVAGSIGYIFLKPGLQTQRDRISTQSGRTTASQRIRRQPVASPSTTSDIPAVDAVPDQSRTFGRISFGLSGGSALVTHPDSKKFIDDLDISFVRVSGFAWRGLEPTQGRFTFRYTKELENLENTDGVETMISIASKSDWGVDNAALFEGFADQIEARTGRRPANPPMDKALGGPPIDWADWEGFVEKLVANYYYIDYWQIGNEPDSASFWAGTTEEYVALVRRSSEIIKRLNPNAKIVLGGFTSEGLRAIVTNDTRVAEIETAFVEQVIEQAKGSYDIVDVHLYGEYQNIPDKISWIRSVLSKYGVDVPLWASEVAGPDSRYSPYTPELEAEEIVKRHALAFSSGVEKVFTFRLGGAGEGLEHFANLGLVDIQFNPKPAYSAYRAMMAIIGSATSIETIQADQGQHIYKYIVPNGFVYVLWSERSGVYALAEHDMPSSVLDIYGNDVSGKLDTLSGNVQINSVPLYVTYL